LQSGVKGNVHRSAGFLLGWPTGGPHPLGKAAAVVGPRHVRRSPLRLHALSPCLIANTFTFSSRQQGHTLSAAVERTVAEAASCPQLQPVISGISSPYRAMYSLWSMSLSRIACLA